MTPTTASRRAGPHRRGAATVEYALLMIVFVPLILYSVFLMDAMYMKIDLQEVAVSGVWDWSTRNTEPTGDNSHTQNQTTEREATQRMVRIAYGDHTSAFDDGVEPGSPGYGVRSRLTSSHNHLKHHIGMGAQYSFRWIDQDDPEDVTDTQFQCRMSDEDLDWTIIPGFTDFGKSDWTAGGKVKCGASAYIYNWIIPREFMQEFSQVNLTDMEKKTGSAHDHEDSEHGIEGGGSAVDIPATATASISYNTWALRNGAEDGDLANADIGDRTFLGTTPDMSGNPFYKRVRSVGSFTVPFIVSYGNVTARALSFTQKAADEELMVVTSVPENPVGGFVGAINPLPNILATHLTARYSPDDEVVRQPAPGFAASWMSDGFQSTPYEGVNDDYKTARQNRRAFYMGCDQAERASCD